VANSKDTSATIANEGQAAINQSRKDTAMEADEAITSEVAEEMAAASVPQESAELADEELEKVAGGILCGHSPKNPLYL
jgi:hypothetical protein